MVARAGLSSPATVAIVGGQSIGRGFRPFPLTSAENGPPVSVWHSEAGGLLTAVATLR